MAALKPEAALEVLEHLLGSAVSQVLVAQIDWRTFLPVYESRARRPLVEAVAGRLPELPVETAGKPELVRELEEAPAAMRRQMLEAYLQREVARVLGLELTAGIEPEQGFFELGMDSLMAVDLKRRLETQLGISLPRTTAFDFPTIATLAAFLLNDLLRLELPSAQIPLVTEQQSQRRELLSEIKTLSDQDVEARLLAELERLNY
jgi:acyl carrier protein